MRLYTAMLSWAVSSSTAFIKEQLGHFTLQGDNNSWTDTYHPSQDEVIGKLWLHIPKGGSAIQKIRNPVTMAVIAGVLGGILALGFFTGKSKGRKRMNKEWFASSQTKNPGLVHKTRMALNRQSHQTPIRESCWKARSSHWGWSHLHL